MRLLCIAKQGMVLLAGLLAMGAGEAPTNSMLSATPIELTGKDGAPMVVIPEGPFIMGSNDGAGNERPEHKVYLDQYAIDKFEVPIGRYAKFLGAAKHASPSAWDDDSVVAAGDRPAVGLSWLDAEAYCK
ncbi:MAG: formylglycine-generating enzyme family protein, partial [Nitrospirae bacterium]|nr:formylglycine-generating enzyme family protein [Nitrospirota bacterium]